MSELDYAKTLLERGDKEGCIKELGRILHVKPRDIEVWLLLAQAIDDNKKKKDCYIKVISIQPDNEIALTELRKLESIIENRTNHLQSNIKADTHLDTMQISSRDLIPESSNPENHMIKLNCPTCGGHLDLPENMSVAHCMYCGNKIYLSESTSGQEQNSLRKYIELCNIAFEAKNYEDAQKYSNLILEIDPDNFEGWIFKAKSTFWLSTTSNNRSKEALEYLNRAEQISPDNPRIIEIRNELIKILIDIMFRFGTESLERAQELYRVNRIYFAYSAEIVH